MWESTQDLCKEVFRQRHQSGLSLRELALVLGVGFSTLARLERGEGMPSARTRLRMAAWVAGENPRDIPCPQTMEGRLQERLDELELRVMQRLDALEKSLYKR